MNAPCLARPQALRDFLAGPELDISLHNARFTELLCLLQLQSQPTRAPAPPVADTDAAPQPTYTFQRLAAAFASGGHKLPYASSRLLERLDETANRRLPYADRTKTRVLVAGAGPIGLRIAIEMCALGHEVTVIEPRDTCR